MTTAPGTRPPSRTPVRVNQDGILPKILWPLLLYEEEFKVLRAREGLQFHISADPKVSGAGEAVNTGRKWRAEWSSGAGRVLVRTVARERTGPGTIASPRFDKA